MKRFFDRLRSVFFGPQHSYNPLPGIQYVYGSWQYALNEAKRQNKPLFVDFLTTDFYPRQQIVREAFSDTSLAVKFNAGFVNYQVDPLRGEGAAVADQYRFNQCPVPTALFVLWDGSLLHRASGYKGLAGLLTEADKALALANEPNRLSMLEQDYLAGNRSRAFLAEYLSERSRALMPNDEALATYLSLVPEADWITDDLVELIIGNLTAYRPEPVDALRQKLRQSPDAPDNSCNSLRTRIGNCIRELIRPRFHQAIADANEQQLAEVIADNESFLRAERGDKLSEQEVDAMINGYRRRFYAETKNLVKYRPLAEAEAWRLLTVSMNSVREKDRLAYQRFEERRKKMDERGERPDYWKYAQAMSTFESQHMASQLHRLVRYYEEHMTEPRDLNQALTWSDRMLAYDRSPGYLGLHARLLLKLGRMTEADTILQEVSAQQTSGTYTVHVVMKMPKDYEQ